jgi:PhzF family phenazine biosynthesis protein
MILKMYQVDAFTTKVFGGNPAAVCPLDFWLPDDIMQQIAIENNLSETVFFVKSTDGFTIRWFTPAYEVDLCGHATLAAAYVLFTKLAYTASEIVFHSPRSGELRVTKNGDLLTLNFPTDSLVLVLAEAAHLACFNFKPQHIFKGKTDLMYVFENQQQIQNIEVYFENLRAFDVRGFIITAPGDHVDFVSRFFGPNAGVLEDPVTGSAHTSLTPYWSQRLGKTTLSALQLSARGGQLTCKYLGERTEISGGCVLYMVADIYI